MPLTGLRVDVTSTFMRRPTVLFALSLVPLMLGCARSSEATRLPVRHATEPSPINGTGAPQAVTSTQSGATTSAVAEPQAAAAPPSEPRRALFVDYDFEKVLDVAVKSIALGRYPKAAVLADAPYLYDGSSWEQRELPKALRASEGEQDEVEVFFGRDNQPRIMGVRLEDGKAKASVYLRHRPGGWKTEPSELGPLAQSSTGLYGLLGFDDPEVVCAPGAFCLVKRLSGWSRIPADEQPSRMFHTPLGVYKADAQRLLVLDENSWSVSGSDLAFVPTDLCHETEDRLWACSGDAGLVHLRTHAGATFETMPVPLQAVQALYCAREGSVWAVGHGGAAYFNGKHWLEVAGDFGNLAHATGRGTEELWLGGERGLFHGRLKQAESQP